MLHIDMDAFFASVEQLVNPALVGKPLLVAGRKNVRGVVCSCSYEAKSSGVKTGMWIEEAQQLCPSAVLVKGSAHRYIFLSEKVFEILESFTPEVEVFSIDEAFLDISDIWHFYGSTPLKLGYIIKKKIKEELGLSSSIGIAGNRLLAKIASKVSKPDGLYWLKDDDVFYILDRLALSEIPGIGPRTAEKLAEFGITNCADLRRIKLSFLQSWFGNYRGKFLFELARGICANKVYPRYLNKGEKSLSCSCTLAHDIYRKDEIAANLFSLAEKLAAHLRIKNFYARTLSLYLMFSDRKYWSKAKTFSQYLSSAKQIYERSLELLKEALPPARAIRMLGISLFHLTREKQLSFFETDKKDIEELIFKIKQRYGFNAISWARIMLSDFNMRDIPSHGFLHRVSQNFS